MSPGWTVKRSSTTPTGPSAVPGPPSHAPGTTIGAGRAGQRGRRHREHDGDTTEPG